MRKLPRWLPWVAAAVIGLIGWQFVALHLRHDGALAQEAKTLRHVNDSLTTADVRKEVVYVHRTDTLRLVRRHTDSLLTTDTLWRLAWQGVDRDTVRNLIAGERLACDAVIQTCEEQKAILRSQVANVQAQLALEKKSHPGWLSRTLTKVTYFGVGFGAAKLLSR